MLLQQRLDLIVSELDGSYSDVVQFFRRGSHCGTDSDAQGCVIANYVRGRLLMALECRDDRHIWVAVTEEEILVSLDRQHARCIPSEVLQRFIMNFDAGDYVDLQGPPRYRRISAPRRSEREYAEYGEYSLV